MKPGQILQCNAANPGAFPSFLLVPPARPQPLVLIGGIAATGTTSGSHSASSRVGSPGAAAIVQETSAAIAETSAVPAKTSFALGKLSSLVAETSAVAGGTYSNAGAIVSTVEEVSSAVAEVSAIVAKTSSRAGESSGITGETSSAPENPSRSSFPPPPRPSPSGTGRPTPTCRESRDALHTTPLSLPIRGASPHQRVAPADQKRGEFFSLSPGERVGVRAGVPPAALWPRHRIPDARQRIPNPRETGETMGC